MMDSGLTYASPQPSVVRMARIRVRKEGRKEGIQLRRRSWTSTTSLDNLTYRADAYYKLALGSLEEMCRREGGNDQRGASR